YGNVEEFSSAGVLSQLSTVVGSISYGGTALEIPDFSTWIDVVKYMPVGMTVVLFRPFPWEQGNTFIRLAGLQQLLLSSAVLLILWSIIERFLPARGKNPMKASTDPLSIFILIYCLGFVSLYGIISGNLGTLVREKIQLVPFIWCAAFAVIRFRRAPVSDVRIL